MRDIKCIVHFSRSSHVLIITRVVRYLPQMFSIFFLVVVILFGSYGRKMSLQSTRPKTPIIIHISDVQIEHE